MRCTSPFPLEEQGGPNDSAEPPSPRGEGGAQKAQRMGPELNLQTGRSAKPPNPSCVEDRHRLDHAYADQQGLSRRVQRHAGPDVRRPCDRERLAARIRRSRRSQRRGDGRGDAAGSQGGNVARQALLRAGLPTSVAGMSLDRQCASGLMAIATAARKSSTTA